jgi:16S rRNA (cytosine967-C5)-methyltransferase
MTPAARISAAIEILDRVLGGTPLEPALTAWGRGNRFAGSGDRAAIRDLVFDAWRCKRSFAALGGGDTGRGLMLGKLRATSQDETQFFTGAGHAPAPPTPLDAPRMASENEALDCPDWLAPRLQDSLGDQFAPIMRALQQRAPVFLRVNLARTTRAAAAALLAADGIETTPHPMAEGSLQVLASTRKIMTTQTYLDGLIELQDVASQAVIEAILLTPGQKVLDYCAGGGGKTLALAAREQIYLWAHDANPSRMRDLAERARRAGAEINISPDPHQHAPYDLVLVDAPCSGSGSWRRDPQGKWALTEARLAELIEIQAQILDTTAPLVTRNGRLAYATCSLLGDENQHQITRFLNRHPDWQLVLQRSFTPLDGGDGFFLSTLTRIQ